MHRTIGEKFSSHIVKMVTRLQIFPVFFYQDVFALIYFTRQRIKLIKSSDLHFISKPCSNITFLISPGYRRMYTDCRYRLYRISYFSRSHKFKGRLFQNRSRHMAEKIKYACLLPVMFPECFIVEENINKLTFRCKLIYP